MFCGIFYLLYIDMTNHIQNLLLMVLNNLTLVMKEKLPRSVGAQYAMGDQWRNNS